MSKLQFFLHHHPSALNADQDRSGQEIWEGGLLRRLRMKAHELGMIGCATRRMKYSWAPSSFLGMAFLARIIQMVLGGSGGAGPRRR